jgi:hypothetical protein
MRFRANLQTIHVHKKQIPAIDAYVKNAIEEGARLWIRAAMEIIPVWSGASRATLQSLASAVDEHIEIDVRHDAPDRIAMGRLHGHGGVDTTGPGSWRFTYSTTLYHTMINETQRVAPGTHGLRGALLKPTPWHFREAGNKVVQAYFKTLEIPLLRLTSKRI